MTELTEQVCPWCAKGIPVSTERCPYCRVRLVGEQTNDTKTQKKSSSPKKSTIKDPIAQSNIVQDSAFSFRKPEEGINTCLAIDPGSRYTGISFLDAKGNILHSTTFVRPKEHPHGMSESEAVFDWLNVLVGYIKEMKEAFDPSTMAIESVVEPKGHKSGVKAALNPKDIMFTGVIAGGLSVAFAGQAVFIKPGGNGSYPDDHYPSEIIGRRGKELPGSTNNAGMRTHEKSAYDVGRKALEIVIVPMS